MRALTLTLTLCDCWPASIGVFTKAFPCALPAIIGTQTKVHSRGSCWGGRGLRWRGAVRQPCCANSQCAIAFQEGGRGKGEGRQTSRQGLHPSTKHGKPWVSSALVCFRLYVLFVPKKNSRISNFPVFSVFFFFFLHMLWSQCGGEREEEGEEDREGRIERMKGKGRKERRKRRGPSWRQVAGNVLPADTSRVCDSAGSRTGRGQGGYSSGCCRGRLFDTFFAI